ncbi:hypothetical protein E2C01_079231 [Portunus trituberculatus]|uniref:Uncharacterized protein n=1 Tax=Portunus trituberculatus TaxID=210409 RepID=A0A5B7IKZ2_PORTR|nr:hypothetical protein [Portunus trituberculatus]
MRGRSHVAKVMVVVVGIDQ